MAQVPRRTAELREALTARRREMEREVRGRIKDGRSDGPNRARDFVDASDVNFQQAIDMALFQMQAATLKHIDEALGRLVRRDGVELAIEDSAAPIDDSDGSVTGAVIVFRDVGMALETSRQMSYLAQHDPLTDLPNRLLLNDRLTEAIALANRRHKPLAVLFLDVDGFKAVNDSLGHASGDEILRSVALRLKASLRRWDTVSRYSGDEFVILLTELEHGDDAAQVATKLVRAASGPHRVGSQDVTVTASVGIALYPDHGRDAETLIAHADTAMYGAKRAELGGYRLFDAGLEAHTTGTRP